MNKKNIVLALLIAFAIGSVVGEKTRSVVDRPLLRWLGGAARLGLKLMVLGEDQPQQCYMQYTPGADDTVNHRRSL